MTNDKKTIGISTANAKHLADLVSRGRFATELDAAKFAMAHAISVGTAPRASESTETKWNVGSVDPDGTLRSILEALYPDTAEPYRLAEYLMNHGIELLSQSTSDPYALLSSAMQR